MSLGKASSEKFAPAKSTISGVQNQLERGFLPAVKHVAASTVDLLKAHAQLEKAAEAHTSALRILADSAKSAQPGARKHGVALEKIIVDYEQLLRLHKGTMTKLNFLASKTTTYANGEKEKLKEMQTIHQKKEKEFLRAEKKKEKTEDELGGFYMAEAKSFSSQQEMRYKFFVDKHLEWFDSFVPMMKLGESFLVHQEVVERVEEIAVHHEEKHDGEHDDHHKLAEELVVAAIIKEEVKEKIRHDIEDRINEAVVRAVEQEVHDHLHERIHDELLEEHHHHDEISEPAQKEKKAYIEEAQKRGVAVAVLPVIPMGEQRHLRPLEPDHDRLPVQSPSAVDGGGYHAYAEAAAASPPPPRPAMLPVVSPPPQPQPVAAPAVIHHTQPVLITAPPALLSPKPPLPAAKPETPVAVSVPVQFGASDYGKALTVLQDFNASSGEQITVAKDDKVILIKSGTRGWIFVRDSVSQRTGWIPSPFAAI